MSPDNRGERFAATGRLSGVMAVLVGLVGVVGGLLERPTIWWLAALGALFAALAWAFMVRPRVEVDDDELVLHNVVTTVRVPLAAVEEVAVRQVLVVRAGDRKFSSPALGRSRRQIRRDERGPRAGGVLSGLGGLGGHHGPARREAAAASAAADGQHSYGLLVEGRIRDLAQQARERAGIRARSAEQVALADGATRRVEPLPAGVLGAAVLAMVLAVVLA